MALSPSASAATYRLPSSNVWRTGAVDRPRARVVSLGDYALLDEPATSALFSFGQAVLPLIVCCFVALGIWLAAAGAARASTISLSANSVIVVPRLVYENEIASRFEIEVLAILRGVIPISLVRPPVSASMALTEPVDVIDKPKHQHLATPGHYLSVLFCGNPQDNCMSGLIVRDQKSSHRSFSARIRWPVRSFIHFLSGSRLLSHKNERAQRDIGNSCWCFTRIPNDDSNQKLSWIRSEPFHPGSLMDDFNVSPFANFIGTFLQDRAPIQRASESSDPTSEEGVGVINPPEKQAFYELPYGGRKATAITCAAISILSFVGFWRFDRQRMPGRAIACGSAGVLMASFAQMAMSTL